MDKKIFIIGLDGATWDIINKLISEDELPTIKNLIKNGSKAVLESTLIPLSPAAWNSFATGCNPNKHEIFDFFGHKKGTYEPMLYSSKDRKRETLWSILSRIGKKVGVINVPGTYPVEKVNGFMISGFPSPEELEDFTYPREILYELRKEIDEGFKLQPRVHLFNETLFLEEVYTLTNYTYQATNYLMNNKKWDFLMTVFVGPDALCHAFWKYMDPKHPVYNPNAPKKFKDAIFNIYKDLDKKIDALKKNIDLDTILILMSDHGFGPLIYSVSINNWLLNEGFMALKKNASTRIRYWMFRRGVNYYNLIKLTKILRLSKYAHKAAFTPKSSSVNLVNKFFLTNKDIDWNKTLAYCMGSFGQLYVNLKNREPQGIVESKDEYYKLVDKIIKKLYELKDPNNNKIIFDKVYSKKEAYPSSKVEDNAPDVIFFNKEMKYSIDKFFMFGSKRLISIHPLWSGTHRHNGIFLACDNDQIRKAANIEKASICDITPTILHLMGQHISKDMDGKVLKEIFKEKSEPYKRKIEYQLNIKTLEMDKINERIKQLKRMRRL